MSKKHQDHHKHENKYHQQHEKAAHKHVHGPNCNHGHHHHEEHEEHVEVETPADQPQAPANELEEKYNTLQEKVLRLHAESENTKRRLERELETAVTFANTSFAKDLMEVMENLHRALENMPKDEAAGEAIVRVMEGIELTRSSLETVFSKHHIERIFPLDAQFDHTVHQAVQQVPGTGKEKGTVIQVIQSGYVLKGRILRPAMVIVAE